jgi:ABC-2 type transport system permease protein
VNREHLTAFIWLRWRLRVNQVRKAGTLNAVVMAIVAVSAVVAAVGLLITGFVVGLLAMPNAPAYAHLWTWDGIVIGFTFWWMIGLMTDLQRNEALAIDKFLHLPVSISGAFLVNYVSSLFSLTLIVFIPGMIGFVIGMAISIGPIMLLILPVMAAFFFALTAITYQFQGWLASMMSNPRKRRTVIVFVTLGFILVAQTPNLINIFRPWDKLGDANARRIERQNELVKENAEKKLTPAEFSQRSDEITEQFKAEQDASERETLDSAVRTTRIINTILPPGWFPLGAAGLAEGKVVPALLATLALGLIGTASLRRAYRTTLKLYTGAYTGGDQKAAAPTVPVVPIDPSRVLFLERKLPGVSEQASAVAFASLRSLLRAPEAKMVLIAPFIMLVVFGGIFVSNQITPPAGLRPLIAFGAALGVLFISGVQLIGNQFGYDRAGFRAYVLSPLPRREILIGKNLAVAPVALSMALFSLLVIGIGFPMRIDHYPAVVAQLLSSFLIFSLLANVLSIIGPIPLASGSMQASSVKAVPVLLQMVFLMTVPFAIAPVLAPYGLEVLLDDQDVIHNAPISLVLSLGLLALLGLFYRKAIGWEGNLLAAREQKVLEVVTSKSE